MADFDAHINSDAAKDEEHLEEVYIAEDEDGPDDDDMSTIMGDEGDDEDNIEKAMLKETDQVDNMNTISEQDDLANVVFRGHGDAVYCAAIHPTVPGLVLTGGGDDKSFLWRFPVTSKLVEADHQQEVDGVVPLEGHTDTITSVGFNFDGSMALTGAYDGTIRIWNVNSGELLRVLEGPEDIEWAHWHSKGNAVIAGSKDGTIWMWLAHNGQCLQVFAGHEGIVSCGVFASEGKVIASGGEDGTVRVWAPKTGVCKHVFEAAHTGLVTCMSTSTKDQELICTGKSFSFFFYPSLQHLCNTTITQHHQRMANDDGIFQIIC
jgi:angio-associated migratory cell protein